jgi:hypothetical protein
MTKSPLLYLAAVFLVGTASTSAPAQPIQAAEFSISFQESRPLDSVGDRVQFVGYKDTRCPTLCVTAGEAHVFLWIPGGTGEEGQVIALPLYAAARGQHVRVGKWEYRLIRLDPHHRDGARVNPFDYKALIALRSSAK